VKKNYRTESFMSNIDKTESCWLWTGATDHGYGVYSSGKAHRISYEIHVGAIPYGLHIDHLCGVKNCVNPAHLEPVTQIENARRRSAKQTHCKNGHKIFGQNLLKLESGWRGCRKCHKKSNNESYRRRMARKRAGALPPPPKEPQA
jgi:hypothetical protein